MATVADWMYVIEYVFKCGFVFILFFWIFHNSLLPFMIGLIIAYILNPAVDLLENKGIGRLLATNIILLTFVFLIILFFLLAFQVLLQK